MWKVVTIMDSLCCFQGNKTLRNLRDMAVICDVRSENDAAICDCDRCGHRVLQGGGTEGGAFLLHFYGSLAAL